MEAEDKNRGKRQRVDTHEDRRREIVRREQTLGKRQDRRNRIPKIERETWVASQYEGTRG